MPNIAMCNFSECPKSNECFRFMAIPMVGQNYIEFKNICSERNSFKWFWMIENDSKVMQKTEQEELCKS
jgi:hypothetical protein